MADKTSEAIQELKKIEVEHKQDEKREAAAVSAPASSAPGLAGGKVEEKPAAKAAEKPAEKREEKKEKKVILERILTAPLLKAFRKPRSHRARVAASLLRQFVARHAKTSLENVRLAGEVNDSIQSRGARNPPKHVKVRISKTEDGIASVVLAK